VAGPRLPNPGIAVLIDTGNGDIGSVFGPTTGLLLGNLAAAGIGPKSIDTILI
jgi:glyoxylase-like metal-dependent hydrolase (beta-lactamase superfamily II)